MFPAPIILIDNEEEELAKLNTAFSLSGLPCLPIQYKVEVDNESGIDHVKVNTDNLRILGIDLNLTDTGGSVNAIDIYPIIERVIEKLDPKGPYFLLFWTKHKEVVNEVMGLMKERSKGVIRPPINYGSIDKTFVNISDSAALKESVIKQIGKSSILEAILSWEERVTTAGSHTINEIHDLTQKVSDDEWDFDSVSEIMKNILIHISQEAVGTKNIKGRENYAIETGLFPIIEDKMLTIDKDKEMELNSKWLSCLGDLPNRNIPPLDNNTGSKLNSLFQVEVAHSDMSKCDRGAFVLLADGTKEDEKEFKSLFGRNATYKSVLTEELLFNCSGERALLNEAVKDIHLGWLEIGAACDHANKKNKLHRYLLAALVPTRYEKLYEKREAEFVSTSCEVLYEKIDGELVPAKGATLYEKRDNQGKIERTTAHEGIYRSSIFDYQGEEYILFVSYKYTVGGHQDSGYLGDVKLRVKDQLLSEISFHWSKYSTRPGITAFH